MDLGFGGCRLVVAVPEASALDGPRTWPPVIRVGTKYAAATAAYMAGLGQGVEIVRLHGSVELAPLVGLADAIVDLTQTGRTLRENRLRIVADVGCSTARLIANQASLKTRTDALQALIARIRAALPSPLEGEGKGGGDAGGRGAAAGQIGGARTAPPPQPSPVEGGGSQPCP